jgi:adenine-specific DNA-methyltransferase
MYPRLFLGRNLLKDDGVIFVSIDDNEVANLRIIMDEIFGEENFITSINWQKKGSPKGVPPEEMIVETHEYILVYQKNRYSFVGIKRNEEDFSNPDNDPRGKWRNTNIKSTTKSSENAFEITDPKTGFVFKDVWAFSKLELANMIKEERLIFPKTVSGQVRAKEFLNEFKNENIPLMSNWGLYDGQEATEFLDTLMGEKIFQNPKNYNLILNLIKYSSRKDDLVLDFFSGSGTTAHAVMDLNAEDEGDRKWICVQLPEITEEDSEAYKAGYKTIAEISRERIRRAGKNIGKGDIGFKSYKLSPSNYRQWNTDIGEKDEKNILKTSKLFLEKPLVDKYDEKSVVYEILVKEGFDFNSKVEPVKDLDRFDYYLVTDSLFEKKLYITFAKKVFAKQVETLKLLESDTFVCFDSALDDTTKVNLGRNINVITI